MLTTEDEILSNETHTFETSSSSHQSSRILLELQFPHDSIEVGTVKAPWFITTFPDAKRGFVGDNRPSRSNCNLNRSRITSGSTCLALKIFGGGEGAEGAAVDDEVAG